MRDESPHFRYVRDPICLGSIALYTVNRFVLKPHGIGGELTHGYLNDLLCLPLFVPIILHIQRVLRLRRHDERPAIWEITQHWLIFSVMFEVVLPRFPEFFRTTSDPLDVFAYAGGGILAGCFWASGRRVRLQIDSTIRKCMCTIAGVQGPT